MKWEDVAGLEGAKETLKEAVILPIKVRTLGLLFMGLMIVPAFIRWNAETVVGDLTVRSSRNREILPCQSRCNGSEFHLLLGQLK